jgi:hypothetical protein
MAHVSNAEQTTKSAFSLQRQRLIEILQETNFGSLEGLHIRDGEPVFTPSPQRVRLVRFLGDNGPRPESAKSDFVLKAKVRDFLDSLDTIRNGVIESIKIEHGIPVLMTIREEVHV